MTVTEIINAAKQLPEYERKQIVIVLMASMLGEISRADALLLARSELTTDEEK